MTTVPTSPLPPPEGSGSRRPVTPPPPSPPRASRRPATPPARSASPTFSTPPPSPPPPPPPPLMDRGSPSPPRGRGDEAYFPRNRPRSPSPNRGGGNRSRTPSPATSDAGRNDDDLDVDDDDDKEALPASGSAVLLRDWEDRSPKNTTTTKSNNNNIKKTSIPNLDKPKSTNTAASTTTTTTSKLKQPGKKKSKSKIVRSFSGLSNHSSHHKNDKNNLSSLFHVTFPEKQDELERVQEFERIDASLKNDLWYFAKELRQLMAVEVDRNRRYEEGELEEDEVALLNNSNFDEEDICCWRGLEHLLEGDDRVARIRTTLEGIVRWYQEAREMGYHDPEELRVVCKSRTKSDRNRAQKRATADAQYLKKMYKQHAAANANGTSSSNPTNPSTSSSSSSSTKKFVRRISKSFSPPKLNWSPKPSKKGKAQATASA